MKNDMYPLYWTTSKEGIFMRPVLGSVMVLVSPALVAATIKVMNWNRENTGKRRRSSYI